MKRKLIIKFTLLLSLLINFSLVSNSQEDPTNDLSCDIHFDAQNRNMWGPEGEPFSLDFDYDIFWVEPSFNQTIGDIWTDPIFGSQWGAMVTIDFWSLLGSRFSMHGFQTGHVDVTYNAEINHDFPNDMSFNPGETVTIESDWHPLPGWDLSTQFPTAGWVSLDFFVGIHFMVNTQICVGGCTNFSFGINNPTHNYDSINIFYLNTFTGEYNYPCVVNNIPQFCNGDFLPIIIPDFFNIGLTGYITIPYVETTDWIGTDNCLHAHGDSAWWGFELDIIQFISQLATFIPPPAGPTISTILSYLNGSLEIVPGVTVSWDLLSMEIGMDSHLTQDFTFCPDIKSRLTFPTPVDYTEVDANGAIVTQGTNNIVVYNTGNDLNFTYPCWGWPNMPIQVDNIFSNDFTNHTWDSIAFWFHISVFTITIEIHLGPIDGAIAPTTFPPLTLNIPGPCINNPDSICYTQITTDSIVPPSVNTPDIDFSWSFGPLYEHTFPLGYLPLTWFNSTWTLPPVIDTICGIVNVIPNPEMQMDLDFCTPLICWGDSTACIKAIVQNGTPPFTYNWSTGINHTITSRSDSLTNIPLGFYSVTVSDANGCSLTDTLTVSPIDPPLQLSIGKIDVTCVRGSDGILIAVPSGGTPDFTYQWVPTNQSTALIGNLPAGAYCVTVTDALGCTITGCDSLIELHERPPANIISDVTEGCQPLTVHFYEPSPIEGQTYNWNFFDGTSSSEREPIHHYLDAGSFDVSLTVTSVYGCDSTISKYQMINVWPKPNAAFTQFPNSVDLIDPQVYFHNNSNILTNSLWNFGDNMSSTDVHPIHHYENPGQYKVTLIVMSDKGCLDTASYEYINVSDYWTIYVPTAFTPSGDSENEEFRPIHHNLSLKGYHFKIFDRWGKMLFETTDPFKGWDGKIDGVVVKTTSIFTWTLVFRDMYNTLRKMNGTVTIVLPY